MFDANNELRLGCSNLNKALEPSGMMIALGMRFSKMDTMATKVYQRKVPYPRPGNLIRMLKHHKMISRIIEVHTCKWSNRGKEEGNAPPFGTLEVHLYLWPAFFDICAALHCCIWLRSVSLCLTHDRHNSECLDTCLESRTTATI